MSSKHLFGRLVIAMVGALVVLGASFIGPGVSPASACSCISIDASVVDGSAGALVGIVEGVTDRNDGQFTAELRVTNDVKSNLADVVFVDSYRDDGANCGWNVQVGSQVAAVVHEHEGRLRLDGCSLTAMSVLDAWEAPVGVGGTAAAFVTTWGGPYRIVAVDSAGTRLAFGTEPGVTQLVGACSDGTTFVEAVTDDDGTNPRLERRRFDDFTIIERHDLVDTDGGDLMIEEVECGSDLYLLWADDAVFERTGWAGWVIEGGDGPTPVDFDAQPQTRIIGHDEFWPTVTLADGGVLEAQDAWRGVFELHDPAEVGATGPVAAAELGAGLGGSTAAGSDNGVAAWLYIAVPLVAAAAIVAAWLTSRKRQ